MKILNNKFWIAFLKFLQHAMVAFIVVSVVVTFIALMTFDTMVGAYFVDGYSNNFDYVGGLWLSIATTGLTIVLGLFSMVSKYIKKNPRAIPMPDILSFAIENFGPWAFWISFIGSATDVYLDTLSVDFFSYGYLVRLIDLDQTIQPAHLGLRVVVGILSLVGEPLAMLILGGFGLVIEAIITQNGGASFTPAPQKPKYPTSNTVRNSRPVPQSAQPQRPIPKPRPQPLPGSSTREPTYHPVSYEEKKPIPVPVNNGPLPIFSQEEINKILEEEGSAA